MLIAYSTAEEELASDVGAYAKFLAEEIVKPVEAVVMFRRVQVRVHTAIGQTPWMGLSGLDEVYLAGVEPPPPPRPIGIIPIPNAPETQVTQKTAMAETPAAVARLSGEEEAWNRIKDTSNPAALGAFLDVFSDNSEHGKIARARLEDLRARQAESQVRQEKWDYWTTRIKFFGAIVLLFGDLMWLGAAESRRERAAAAPGIAGDRRRWTPWLAGICMAVGLVSLLVMAGNYVTGQPWDSWARGFYEMLRSLAQTVIAWLGRG
jgi:hypothetical protein